LPVVLDEHSDIGCLVSYMEIAEPHAFCAHPRDVRISTIGLSQDFVTVEDAVGDAVKATIESRRRAAPQHGE
jgi:hypothetical protein